jgi:hypothetical protein
MSVIIFVHKGSPEYLEYILKLTKNTNPGRVILLGDESNKDISVENNVEHHLVSDYNQTIPYYHISVNSEQYEKFCFERWFVIKNFVIKHGITHFIHSDSDNALLTDFSKFTYTNAGFSHNNKIVPNVIFMTVDAIIHITDFYLKLYSLPINEFKESIRPFLDKINGNDHYSDMYFLRQAMDISGFSFEILDESKFTSWYDLSKSYYNLHFTYENKTNVKAFYDKLYPQSVIPLYFIYTPDYIFWKNHITETLHGTFDIRPIAIEKMRLSNRSHHMLNVTDKIQGMVTAIQKNMGSYILFTDATIFINKNKVRQFKKYIDSYISKNHDMVYAYLAQDPINMGVMLINCNDKTLAFYQNILSIMNDSIKNHIDVWDQGLVNNETVNGKINISWCFFDDKIWVGGQMPTEQLNTYLLYKSTVDPMSNRQRVRLTYLYNLKLIDKQTFDYYTSIC